MNDSMKVNNSNKKTILVKKCYMIKVIRLSVCRKVVNPVQLVKRIQYNTIYEVWNYNFFVGSIDKQKR